MNKVIEVEGLSFSYGNGMVLDNIGFSVFEGDFAGIIGSNGTGKSTLLKLLLGLLQPLSGSIRLLGEDIRLFKRWPEIGYVPQNAAVVNGNFPATAEEVVKANLFSQIGLMRFPKKQHVEKARHALEQVGMEQYAGRLIGNLSGGQQQRVMLARVLVNQPRVMLLDEPTTGVDAKSADSLYQLLERLNKESGLTIVMVTHDMARTSNYVNRKICMDDGVLEEMGPENTISDNEVEKGSISGDFSI